jgi:superfamily I DNA and/or RNA helicase
VAKRLVFFDVLNSEEIFDNKSKCNLEEADFIKTLVDYMARKMSLQGTLKYVKN